MFAGDGFALGEPADVEAAVAVPAGVWFRPPKPLALADRLASQRWRCSSQQTYPLRIGRRCRLHGGIFASRWPRDPCPSRNRTVHTIAGDSHRGFSAEGKADGKEHCAHQHKCKKAGQHPACAESDFRILLSEVAMLSCIHFYVPVLGAGVGAIG